MTTKFTIVMPCFNSVEFIQDALDSVRSQSYSNYELIVIDGASNDGTLEILKSNIDIIKILISEPDDGQSDALTKGFSFATGDYYLWLNADDLMTPDLLESANNLILSNKHASWINFGTIIVRKNKSISTFISPPAWLKIINQRYRPQISSPTTIFHRDLYIKSGGFDVRFHYTMDVDLWRTFIEIGFRWYRLDCYGIAFREHENSKTNKGYIPDTISDSQKFESLLMASKHNFNMGSMFYRSISKFWRILNCFMPDFLNGLRWRNKFFGDYLLNKNC